MADHRLTAQEFHPHCHCANDFGERVELAPIRACARLCKNKNGQDCAEQMTVMEGLEPSKEVVASGM
eukprot:6695780-Lingulodinium_polyedra.AAC.1